MVISLFLRINFSSIFQILGGAVIALILNNGEYFRSRYDQIYYAYGCHYFSYSCKAMLFMLLMATTFFICTFILLLSCIFSFSTGGLISKTLYVSTLQHNVRFQIFKLMQSFFLHKITGINLSYVCGHFIVSRIDFKLPEYF